MQHVVNVNTTHCLASQDYKDKNLMKSWIVAYQLSTVAKFEDIFQA